MKELLESWREYEKKALDEDKFATAMLTEIANPRMGEVPAGGYGEKLARDWEELKTAVTSINRYGMPALEDIRELQDLSDEELEEMNYDLGKKWDPETLDAHDKIDALPSEEISQMSRGQAMEAAKRYEHNSRSPDHPMYAPRGDYDPDRLKELQRQAINGPDTPGNTMTREDIEELSRFEWSDIVLDPDDKIGNTADLAALGATFKTGGSAGPMAALYTFGRRVKKGVKGVRMLGKLKKAQKVVAGMADLKKLRLSVKTRKLTGSFAALPADATKAQKLRRAKDYKESQGLTGDLNRIADQLDELDLLDAKDIADAGKFQSAKDISKLALKKCKDNPKTCAGVVVGTGLATKGTADYVTAPDPEAIRKAAAAAKEAKATVRSSSEASAETVVPAECGAGKIKDGQGNCVAATTFGDDWSGRREDTDPHLQESLKRIIREEVIGFFNNREG